MPFSGLTVHPFIITNILLYGKLLQALQIGYPIVRHYIQFNHDLLR